MHRRSAFIAAAALLIFIAVLVGLTLSSAATPTLAEGQSHDGIEFRPRLDKVQEPVLPPPASHPADASDNGGHQPPAPVRSPWVLFWALGSVAAIPLLYLLAVETRAVQLLGALSGSQASSGAPSTGRPTGSLGWWGRFALRAGYTWDRLENRYERALDWARYTAWPEIAFFGKSAGHYFAGLAFEFTSDLGFGAGHGLLRLIGKDPDRDYDPYFLLGRKAGATAFTTWGYLEIGAGFFGKGGGLLASLTGGGAVVGVPSMAAGAALALAGSGHVAFAQKARRDADEAYRRSGGVSWPKETKLLSEEEVRKLLGPNASEQAVQRFMAFQEYAARTLGANLTSRKVRELYANGLGPALERWIQELPHDKAEWMLEHYAGNRRLLSAIHESRYAQMLAENPETNAILKVNEDVALRGPDVVYWSRQSKRLKMVDVKSSLSGGYFGMPGTFDKHLAENLEAAEKYAESAAESGLITSEEERLITASVEAKDYDLEVVEGGTATVTDSVKSALAKRLHIPEERITIKQLPNSSKGGVEAND